MYTCIYIHIYIYICIHSYINNTIPGRESYLVLQIQPFAAGTCGIFRRERLERQALCVVCNEKAGRFVLSSILEFSWHLCRVFPPC